MQGLPAPAADDRRSLPPRPASPRPTRPRSAGWRDALRAARRPVFVAGRGARGPGSRAALEALAERCGALLATSAVAKGLFRGSPWDLDVSGGFATPLAAELIGGADLVVGWGCALNMWTMRHGRLIADDAVVVQVDRGARRRSGRSAMSPSGSSVTSGRWPRRPPAALPEQAAGVPDAGGAARDRRARPMAGRAVRGRRRQRGCIDPRTLTIALDDLLPAERVVAVDSGNFMGYPSMFLDVPDEHGFCFTQAFQSVGLGLATAIGAALARPDRLPVAALGDGGALMGASELETVVRLGLPMVVVVYDDAAYGAEVHHFGPDGHPLDTVRFPETDFAAIARGYGFEARDRPRAAPTWTALAGLARPARVRRRCWSTRR